MFYREDPKLIKRNLSVLLKQGLRERKSTSQFIVAAETCRALKKLIPPKDASTGQAWRYEPEHEIFSALLQVLRDGLWSINDPYYVTFADEAINLIFSLSLHPDTFSESLLRILLKRIQSGYAKRNSGKQLHENQTHFEGKITSEMY